MIHDVVFFLQTHILPLGPFGVLIASLIEEIIAPIPSAVVMLGGGFLFVEGAVNISTLWSLMYNVALPAAVGVSFGSLVVYSIARFIGTAILIRWGAIFGVTEKSIEDARAFFQKNNRDTVSVLIARIVPIVPAVVIALGAGIARMPVAPYLTVSFLGTLVRAAILGFVGWQVGEVYLEYAEIIGRWEKVALLAIGVTGLCALIYLYLRNKKEKNSYGNI